MIQNNKAVYVRKDKSMYFMEFIHRHLINRYMLERISKTAITPNMITVFNFLVGGIAIYFAYKEKFLMFLIVMQTYAILDNLDGMLARYTDNSTEFGRRLDIVADTLFYNLCLVFIGIKNIELSYLIASIIAMNVYNYVTKYYIVPRIIKLKHFKRDKVKSWFLSKGFLIGMNVDTLGLLMLVLLPFQLVHIFYLVTTMLFIIDLLYRLIELKYNEKLNIE